MPVTDITTDIENRTLTITAEFAAPVERLWALYADPRQLEKVWGPPTHPATFVEHRLVPGERSTYFMTAPDGERFAGWWLITAANEPTDFAFDDGFAHDDFTPNTDLPTSHNEMRFEPVDGAEGRTRSVSTSRYESAEALEQVVAMGIEEGSRQAINQIDEFLAAHP